MPAPYTVIAPDRVAGVRAIQAGSSLAGVALGSDELEKIERLPHAEVVNCMAISPNGRLLATHARDGRLRLWDLTGPDSKPDPILVPIRAYSFLRSDAFLPDSRSVLSLDVNGTAMALNAITGELEERLTQLGTNHNAVAVSPDGSLVACTLTRFHPGTSDAECWIEVRSSRDGSPVRSIRVGTDLGQVGWAPSGRRLTYVTRGKVPKAGGGEREVGTVWLMDLETGVTDPLLERVEDLTGYAWSPTGYGLAYERLPHFRAHTPPSGPTDPGGI